MDISNTEKETINAVMNFGGGVLVFLASLLTYISTKQIIVKRAKKKAKRTQTTINYKLEVTDVFSVLSIILGISGFVLTQLGGVWAHNAFFLFFIATAVYWFGFLRRPNFATRTEILTLIFWLMLPLFFILSKIVNNEEGMIHILEKIISNTH